jgi:hypothetical protein
MERSPPAPDFWSKVRDWRDKRWGIALHGLHHRYHPDPPGTKSIVPFHREGEYVGLPLAEQRAILRKAWEIFHSHDISPEWFIAPSHSFDRNTLEALRIETDIRYVSDGLSFRPFERFGFGWLPQQLWGFDSQLFGVWTVCFHPNTMTEHRLATVIRHLYEFRDRIASPSDFSAHFPRHGLLDAGFEHGFFAWHAFKRRARKLIPRRQ